jgi:nicotinate-nucleotide adenylyltransferase
MRIGVLGGTFDPLHYGHLRAAEVARERGSLDKVIFVPAATPPHKTDEPIADAHHRTRMVELALRGETEFELSRIEVERGGPSYTIDTLTELSERSPQASWFFITGTDAFVEIRTWHRWEELLDNDSFIVHERPGCSIDRVMAVVPEALCDRVRELPMGRALGTGPRILLLRDTMLDVSSTEIRRILREGRTIRFLVPDAVEDYLRECRLYDHKGNSGEKI